MCFWTLVAWGPPPICFTEEGQLIIFLIITYIIIIIYYKYGQVAEISRVLRPGGVYVASTILDPSSRLQEFLGDDLSAALAQVSIKL